MTKGSYRALVFALLMTAALAVVAVVTTQTTRSGSSPSLQTRRQAILTASRQGLQAAAALSNGMYVGEVSVHEGAPASFHQLVAFSHVIVVGRAESNRSSLTPSGRSISMNYTVRISSVLKGAPLSDPVTVVIPGGRVSFPDGSIAQLDTPGFLRPFGNRNYVWFLRAETAPDAQQAKYRPTLGPLGIYDIEDPSRVVKPSGGFDYPFTRRLVERRMTAIDFVQAITEATAR